MTEIHSRDTDQWLDSKCTKCAKIIRTNMGRERHVQLYCDSCRLCSPERTSFDIHMSSLHSELIEQKRAEEEPQCIKCEQKFKSFLDLKVHDETEHGTSKVSKSNENNYD